MGTYYSIFDNDEIYCDEFNTLRIDRPEPRHPFDIPVPEDNTFFIRTISTLTIGTMGMKY